MKSRSERLLPCFGLLIWLLLAQASFSQNLFLEDAKIVDTNAKEVYFGNLLIENGKIAGRPETAPATFDGETIDLDGLWVIPGLADLHTHSYGNMAPNGYFDAPGTPIIAKRMLYAGVVAFLDLFGPEEMLYEYRNSQHNIQSPVATLYASLSCLTATEGHCTEYGVPTRTIDNPEAAREVVTDLATLRPNVVKIVYAQHGSRPSLDRETLAAAIETATVHGLKTIIHIHSWEDARDAIEFGASAITHIPPDPLPQEVAEMMADKRVASIPTLSVEIDVKDFLTDEAVRGARLASELAPKSFLKLFDSDVNEDLLSRAEEKESNTTNTRKSIELLYRSGVPILLGTDSGNIGTIQGYSVHRELQLLVELGMSSWDALGSATSKASEFLGKPWGVHTGEQADLLVVSASPISDISNTQRIEMVIKNGVVVDRERLREELSVSD